MAHWLAAYDLVRGDAHPAPRVACGRAACRDEVLAGPAEGLHRRACMDDEFPLSMFFEALEKKMADVIESTEGITGSSD